eukprot:4424711-Karenia_brevis.AAC.1
MISLVWRGTGVDELHIDSVRQALIIWAHVIDINSKVRRKLTNLSEEAMTLEWAGISFEQDTWQYLHRIAMASGKASSIPLLSGNAGYMVA